MNSSSLKVRLGAELPQIIHAPPDVASHALGEDAIRLANAYLFDEPACLSPSQELRLRNGMATRADGKWAASRVADFGGRQGAGKTDTIIARILAGVLLLDEQLIIYTAHEFPTANEIFLRLGRLFNDWDDLADELARDPKRAHGDQGFELKGDRRILIKTRTGKSGRGFAKADLVIYDEAQHLLREHVAGSGPAKLAHPNPQSWYAGSGGLAHSAVAWDMRRQAVSGRGGRLSYTEHTAQRVTLLADGRVELVDPDPDDRDAWAEANPGLGRWVTEEGMEDLRDELRELFPREGLCVWEPEPSSESMEVKLDQAKWQATARHQSPTLAAGEVTIGFDVAEGWASVGVAAGSLGRSYVECVEHHSGTGWLPARLVELVRRWRPPAVGLDGGNGAAVAALGEIRELFEVEGLDPELVRPLTSAQYKAACESMVRAVDELTVSRPDHGGRPDQLQAAGQTAVSRTIGESFVWDRRLSTLPVSPLVSVTIARSLLSESGSARVHELSGSLMA